MKNELSNIKQDVEKMILKENQKNEKVVNKPDCKYGGSIEITKNMNKKYMSAQKGESVLTVSVKGFDEKKGQIGSN